MGKTILHICNDFSGSLVHKRLYSILDHIGLPQTVYVPVKNKNLIGRNSIRFKTSTSSLFYSNIIKIYHRVFFHSKIREILSDIEVKVPLEKTKLIHATTLFSDGAPALKCKLKHNIPFIVTIRSTDVNIFYKYGLHLRKLGNQILEQSNKIIFISPSLKDQLLNQLKDDELKENIESKSIIIMNGLDDWWLNNTRVNQKAFGKKILYVGNFSYNKNVISLIKAVLLLREEHPEIELSIVGDGGLQSGRIMELAKKFPSTLKVLGPISDKEKLQEVYRDHNIFAMVSKSETFGLVYVEALSQGLPIIYSKGTGIDGAFLEKVGEPVDSRSVSSIAKGITKILDNYSSYGELPQDFCEKFNWKNISQKYLDVYAGIDKSL